MLVFFNRYKRMAVIITLASAQLALGQTSSGGKITKSMRSELTPQTSPERVKDLLLATMFTTCSVPGSADPTMFYYSGLFFEYRKPWSRLIPLNLTESDKLNGIQYHGLVVVSGSSYRSFSGREWSSWDASDLKSVSTPRLLAEARHQYSGAVLEIEKKNNEWNFRFSSLVGSIDPDEYGAKKRSWGMAMSSNPLSDEK